MKKIYFWAVAAATSMGLLAVSCTTENITEITIVQPDDDADYEYLAEYDVIKSYTDANIGGSVDASIYNEGGAMAVLINSNFDEVVASYHMKYGGVVQDDGSMNFSVVDKFVDNATNAGLSIFGHALCWHSGQNTTYLNSLIADRWVEDAAASVPAFIPQRLAPMAVMPRTGAAFVASRVDYTWGDNVILNGDFEGTDGGSFFVSDNNSMGVTAEISADGQGAYDTGHSYVLTNPTADGQNYYAQLGIQFLDTPLAAGEEWMLSFDVKSSNGTAFSGTHLQPGGTDYSAVGGKYYGDIATTTEWSHVEFPIDVDADGVAGGVKIVMGFGQAADVIYIDNIVFAKKVYDSGSGDDYSDWTQMMFEGDFSEGNKGTTYDIYNTYNSDSYSVTTDGENNLLVIDNTTAGNNWEPQLAVLLPSGVTFAAGETWAFRCKVKSINSSNIEGVSFQVAEGGDALSGMYYTMQTSSEWQELTLEFDVDGEGLATAGKIVMGLGAAVDTFTFDDLEFLRKNGSTTTDPDTGDDGQEDEYTWGDELIVNGDFETAVDNYETDSWLAQVNGASSGADFSIVDGVDGGSALRMNNGTICTNKWDTQFIIIPNIGAFAATDILKVEFDIKSDNGSTITGSHSQTATYAAAYSSGDITTSTEWTHYCFIFSNATDGTNFAMQFGDVVDAFYFDNISFQKGSITPTGGYYEPLTDEEKAEAVTTAMQDWITEMISHTSGKVNAWDVVNEPIDDATPTSLRTGVGASDNENFYWQDYMGQDYVRQIVKMAREAAGEQSLTLFINDYGLEFAHDNNAKCDALIDWIEYWESDGETVIDGIGTQMHVSLSLDGSYQQQQEDAVVAMFEKLAATGKLIRISELDMRLQLSDGSYQTTTNITEAQHLLMSEYYEFIISKYFEIIPESQQFGVTHWSPTDASDDENAWCSGEPIGLWTTDYDRKHTYAGFIEGLLAD
ncbi:MAG: endo-1,4-beta-xylanase [Rikenellaceae bacterium]